MRRVTSTLNQRTSSQTFNRPTNDDVIYSAISGENTFSNEAIPNEGSLDLYYSYDIKGAANQTLLVFIHGWGGAGGAANYKAEAATYLKNNNISIMTVGMRGRNTGVDFANDGVDVEEYRDASAVEIKDVIDTIDYVVNNVAQSGQINTDKIVIYGISGGGGNSVGIAAKYPEYASMIVNFYGIGKYGTYTDDPNPSLTSWYTDSVNFQGTINIAVGGAPQDSVDADMRYLARDNNRGAANFTGKFYIYHDTNDNTVSSDLSDDLASKITGETYFLTTDETYQHGNFDLSEDYFDSVTPFGLDWVTDAQTLTRQSLANTGTLHVAGYVITNSFEIWLKHFRKNLPASPRAAQRDNQGKRGAASVVYNITAETYTVTPEITTGADDHMFIDITQGSKTALCMLNGSDTATITPKTLNKQPESVDADWKVFYDLSDSDSYQNESGGKCVQLYDLSGNENIAWQNNDTYRATVSGNAIDFNNSYLYQLAGTSGATASNVDLLEFSGAFTIIFCIDLKETSISNVNEEICGRGAGGQSLIKIDNSGGKLQINVKTNTGTLVSDNTPNNTDLGKQAWEIRRDSSNNIYAKCVNSSGTYDYGNIGTLTGVFNLRILGRASSPTPAASNYLLYQFAAAEEDIDTTSILTAWQA